MGKGANKHVVVIGAGIVGASLAYHLAAKGAQVTVIEAGEVASGVTGRSFAWINATHPGPDPIAQLRGTAIEAYHRLETELPALQIRWTGALSYSEEVMQACAQSLSASLLSRAEIQRLEPNLKHPPQQAFYKAEEGALDAVQATHVLISAAQALGAKLLTQTTVSGFTTHNSTVTGVETAAGCIAADTVILAAGTGTRPLAAMLNISLPLAASPAIFIRYKARADLVNGIISSPAMEVREGADGTLLAAEDYLSDAPEHQPMAIALQTAKAIQSELRAVSTIEPETACIGLRPMPEDGVPIVGYLPGIGGVYVCVMHPGVTLAATVGRLVSEEIVGGTLAAALVPCSPQRFLEKSTSV